MYIARATDGVKCDDSLFTLSDWQQCGSVNLELEPNSINS